MIARVKEEIKIMAFNVEYGEGLPKGRVVPMYLTEDGDLFPLAFSSEEQLDLVATMIGIAMEHKIVVDTRTLINAPTEKLSIYNMKTKEIL